MLEWGLLCLCCSAGTVWVFSAALKRFDALAFYLSLLNLTNPTCGCRLAVLVRGVEHQRIYIYMIYNIKSWYIMMGFCSKWQMWRCPLSNPYIFRWIAFNSILRVCLSMDAFLGFTNGLTKKKHNID